jgi:DNA-binding CsgD family transcriptional regulator
LPKRQSQPLDRSDAAVIERLAKLDPARTIITMILRLVPVSHWAFARFAGDGNVNQLLSKENGEGREGDFAELKAEFILQRQRVHKGPRIAATLSPLTGEYESGLTLLFADQRANLGILVLQRTTELGPFTSSEIRTLTLALDSASELLSDLRLLQSPEGTLADSHLRMTFRESPSVATEPDSSIYVLNRDFEIILAWTAEHGRDASPTTLNLQTTGQRLPSILEKAVRELTAAWGEESRTQVPGVSRPVPFVVIRTQPLSGPMGLCIGVLLERSAPRHSLTSAAERFNISAREVQTLSLLLHGATLDEIAEALHITASTVQDHIRSLLDKTGTHGRSEMIAKIFGWGE